MMYNKQNEVIANWKQEHLSQVSHVIDTDVETTATPSVVAWLTRTRIAIVFFVAAVFLSISVTTVQAGDLQAQSNFQYGGGGVHLVQ